MAALCRRRWADAMHEALNALGAFAVLAITCLLVGGALILGVLAAKSTFGR